MAPIVLKVIVPRDGITKAVQCDPSITVYDACQHIRQKIPQVSSEKSERCGLFCAGESENEGFWLEDDRTLSSYNIRSGSVLQYGSKYHFLRVKTLDNTIRTMLIDETLPLLHITRYVCAKIGLINHQEFSFTIDYDNSPSTVQKDWKGHSMDKMKGHWQTDEELTWVSPALNLRQHDLLDPSVLLTLRKKLFFTDENVNHNDPVQLHLLFVQCRQAVLEGKHPVMKQEAVMLAAFQLQADFGSHKEGRHITKSMLKDILPQEYCREKAIDKLVTAEHRNLYELSILNAKFRYIQLCRSLKTYGVSFFTVKEKIPGRNRLRMVLLGISRDGVQRLDRTSKKLLNKWPLSTIKSFASTPTSFCLNFGGYEAAGGCYIVKTSDGEAITQLLDGYINLIMDVKPVEPFAIPGDTSETTGKTVEGPVHKETKPPLQIQEVLLPAEQCVHDSIAKALKVIENCTEKLKVPSPTVKKLSKSMEEEHVANYCHTLTTFLSFMLTHTAALFSTSNDHSEYTDYVHLKACIIALEVSIERAVEACCGLAGLAVGEGSGKILKESHSLVSAVDMLLKACHPRHKVVGDMMRAAGDVGHHCEELVNVVGLRSTNSPSTFPLVAEIKHRTRMFVGSIKRIEQHGNHDDSLLGDLHLSIEEVNSSCQSLTTSATVLLCHILASDGEFVSTATGTCSISPSFCCQQLLSICRYFAFCLEKLCLSAQSLMSTEQSLLKEAGECSVSLTRTLHSFMERLMGEDRNRDLSAVQDAYHSLVTMGKSLESLPENNHLVLQQAKALAVASHGLVKSVHHFCSIHSSKVMVTQGHSAADVKDLASVTARMAETAKARAASVEKERSSADLVTTVRELSSLATVIVTPYLTDRAISKLRLDSRDVAMAISLICCLTRYKKGSSGHSCVSLIQCEEVGGCIFEVVRIVQNSRWLQGENDDLLMELIHGASSLQLVSSEVVSDLQQKIHTIHEPAMETLLKNTLQYAVDRLTSLRSSIAKVVELIKCRIDDLIIAGVQRLVQSTCSMVEECRNTPLSSSSYPSLGSSPEKYLARTVQHLQTLLLPLTMSGYDSTVSSYRLREIGQYLQQLKQACYSVACRSEDVQSQLTVLQTLLAVLQGGKDLMVLAKSIMDASDQPDFQPQIAPTVVNLSSSLSSLLSASCHSSASPALESLIQQTQRVKQLHYKNLFKRGTEEDKTKAIEDFMEMKFSLTEVRQPLSNSPHHALVQTVDTASQKLFELLCDVQSIAPGDVTCVSELMCEILEATAQAAYLVGASQPSSMPAPPPFFDETEVTTASFMIKVLCNELQTTDSCLSLPYISDSVVRYSSILYTSCKRYASLSISPTTQSDLVLVAEHVRKTSTSLICSIQTSVRGARIEGDVKERSGSKVKEVGDSAKCLSGAVCDVESLLSAVQSMASAGHISEEGVSLQQNILQRAQTTLATSQSLILSLSDAATSQSALAKQQRDLKEELQALLCAVRSAAPCVKEIESVISSLTTIKAELQQAFQQASDHTLTPQLSGSLPMLLKEIVETCFAAQKSVKSLDCDIQIFTREVVMFEAYCSRLLQATTSAASQMYISNQQLKMISHSMTVIESALQLCSAMKHKITDPHDSNAVADVQLSERRTLLSLQQLQEFAEDCCSLRGLIMSLVMEIQESMLFCDVLIDSTSASESLDQLMHHAEAIVGAMQGLVTNKPLGGEMCTSSYHVIASSFAVMSSVTHGLSINLIKDEHSVELREAVQSVGVGIIKFFQSTAIFYPNTREVLSQDAATVAVKLSELILVARGCFPDILEQSHLMSTMQQLTYDMDVIPGVVATSSLSEGQSSVAFDTQRQEILKSTKTVSLAMNNLEKKIEGHGSDLTFGEESHDGGGMLQPPLIREDMAVHFQHVVTSLSFEANLLKDAVTRLTPTDDERGKILLMTAARDVVDGLQQVLTLYYRDSGIVIQHVEDPLQHTGSHIQHTIKNMRAAHSRLISAVTKVDSGATDQTLAFLHDTIDFLYCTLEDFKKPIHWTEKMATLSYITQTLKNLSVFTSQIAAAYKSSNASHLTWSIFMGRNLVVDLLCTLSSMAGNAYFGEEMSRLMVCASDATLSFLSLLEHLRDEIDHGQDEPQTRDRMEIDSGDVMVEEKKQKAPCDDIVQDVGFCLNQIVQILSSFEDFGSKDKISDEDLTSSAGEHISTTSEMEMTDMPHETESDFFGSRVVWYVGKINATCREVVQCVKDGVTEKDPREEHQSLLYLALQLSEASMKLNQTTYILLGSYIGQLKLSKDCRDIMKQLSWMYLLATTNMETGNAVSHEMKTFLMDAKKFIDSIVTWLEEDTIRDLEIPPLHVTISMTSLPLQDTDSVQAELEFSQMCLSTMK